MYRLDDLRQAATGAMTGILGLILFFVFGDINQKIINPGVGFILTIVFVGLAYFSIKKFMGRDGLQHLLIDLGISFVIAVIIGFVFSLISLKILFSFDVFGSIPMIITWIIFIPAVIFDVKDTGSFLERYTYFGGDSKLPDNPIIYYCNSRYKTKEDISKCLNK